MRGPRGSDGQRFGSPKKKNICSVCANFDLGCNDSRPTRAVKKVFNRGLFRVTRPTAVHGVGNCCTPPENCGDSLRSLPVEPRGCGI